MFQPSGRSVETRRPRRERKAGEVELELIPFSSSHPTPPASAAPSSHALSTLLSDDVEYLASDQHDFSAYSRRFGLF